MHSILRRPLKPVANLSALVITRRLPLHQHHGRPQQLHFSAISSDRKQGRVKRKKKLDSALQLLEVPDYLIPLAYRQQQPPPPQHQQQILDDGKKKVYAKHHNATTSSIKSKRGVGGSFASLFSRSSSPTSTRPTHHHGNNATYHHHSPSRHQRKSASQHSAPSSQSSSTINSNINYYELSTLYDSNVESLRQMENSLNEKMSDYIKNRGLGGNGTTTGAPTTTFEESSSVQLIENSIAMDVKFYNSLVTDFHQIILGWCEVAESICATQRILNSTPSTPPPQPKAATKMTNEDATTVDAKDAEEKVDLLPKYEDAMCRAMRHLDSLEGLYRTNGSVDPSLRVMEKEKAGEERLFHREKEERGKTVIDDIASFIGNIFSNPKRETTTVSTTAMNSDENSTTKSRIRDVHLITSLYEQILLAFHSSSCFGANVQRKSIQKSNQLLKKWIPLYCCTSPSSSESTSIHPHEMNHSDEEADELGARNIFHTVIRLNVDLSSNSEAVESAEYWLSIMHSLAQAGYSNCAPDADSYNLVLLGYCNSCKSFSFTRDKSASARRRQLRRRRFIVEGVERVLLQLAECKEESCSVNITSLNLALNALAKAGRHSPESNCQRTNNLLMKFLGEEKFRDLVKIDRHDEFINEPSNEFSDDPHLGLSDSLNITSDVVPKINLEPNLDTYHWLVDVYSNSADIRNIMRSLSFLRKMVKIRNKESQTASASFAPSVGTHCKVLRALLAKVDELSDNAVAEIVKEMTQFLDSMVVYGSSFPNHQVYLSLLQLWQKSRSPEAGQYAEEILSRWEISMLYQSDVKILSLPYFIALSCWLTSAMAGRSDAAERAYRLLNIMEARAGKDEFFSSRGSESYDTFATSEVLDRSSDPQIQMYTIMLRICAATNKKADSSQAVSIAFEIYDKMIQGNIKPGPKTFDSMYTCVKTFLDQHPEAESQALLLKVFKMASKHGVSRGEVLGRYKESLRRSQVAGRAG